VKRIVRRSLKRGMSAWVAVSMVMVYAPDDILLYE
jgi:hypothetical protein